jgi:hypothetical protein
MAVDLKKWKQRNAAARVKAALTRPKKDNTSERLRAQFSAAAAKAIDALRAKGRHPWLRYGFNDDVVVTVKLGSRIIPVTGDEAIALPPGEAEAYLEDVIEATKSGQLDRDLLATAGPAPAAKPKPLKLKTVAETPKPQPAAPATAALANPAPAPASAPARDLRFER